jgi:hypothetical protein
MKYLMTILQIGELFDGKFNWRGIVHLSLFILMGLIMVSFSIWIGYHAFSSGRNNKK